MIQDQRDGNRDGRVNTERKIKGQFRMDKRRWNKDFASESENAARQQHMKTFFPQTKVLRNQRHTRCATVKDKNDILSDKQRKTKRWYEHCNEVLNRENLRNPASIAGI